ncbi:O-antigen ligase family protein [Streptomyces sp. V4-01]|uniref:O-antigen ligase family protein n=1 Tax=Actinacidiphila polyblastidii TaxID=3110430 RepID=A0ABU7PIR9_9ACTN|nr:O-antigen ligase family protein [Streptomyces sp. V4-01]
MNTTAGGPPDARGAGVRGAGVRPPSGRPASARTTAAGAGARGAATDATGVALLVCCAVWTLIAAAGRPARPEGTLLALLAVTAGFAAGRILGALLPVLAPAAAAVAVLALVLVPHATHRPRPGHADSDAALLVIATGAACCAAWSARGRPARAALGALGLAATAAALVLGSATGAAAGAAVVLCSAASGLPRRRAPVLVALALFASLTVGGSLALAADALPPRLAHAVSARLSGPRVGLWRQAATLAHRHPLRGVGPERFADEAAAADSDTRASGTSVAGTPRSAPLQLAAEQGVPGVVLLAASYGWLLTALRRSPRPTPVALTAAAALTALALLAALAPVLSHTAVTAATGFLAGAAAARPLADDPLAGEPR